MFFLLWANIIIFFHYTKPICLLHNDLHILNIIKRPINLGFGAV